MVYNHAKAERRWQLWKEKEEKILRECGVDEETIEEIRTFDRRRGGGGIRGMFARKPGKVITLEM